MRIVSLNLISVCMFHGILEVDLRVDPGHCRENQSAHNDRDNLPNFAFVAVSFQVNSLVVA